MEKLSAEQENAYIAVALHDIEDKRGQNRESVQVFRDFYRALKAAMNREVDWGKPEGKEVW